ncbi:hypothetical protein BY996DRAFT_7190819 [Phakopsora pachyrhizi]|nr:hypothetical protein BY996DRAFT_7190819 [Phakopsora pachyrhizi]
MSDDEEYFDTLSDFIEPPKRNENLADKGSYTILSSPSLIHSRQDRRDEENIKFLTQNELKSKSLPINLDRIGGSTEFMSKYQIQGNPLGEDKEFHFHYPYNSDETKTTVNTKESENNLLSKKPTAVYIQSPKNDEDVFSGNSHKGYAEKQNVLEYSSVSDNLKTADKETASLIGMSGTSKPHDEASVFLRAKSNFFKSIKNCFTSFANQRLN